MSVQQKRESIMATGDVLIYHMARAYAPAATATPPGPRESWTSFTERLEYYLMRGWKLV